MAYKIPTLEKRVARAPLPTVQQTVRATAGSFGAPQAEAIGQISRDVSSLGADLERREEKKQKVEVARQKAADKLQDKKDKAYAEQEFLSFQEERVRYENNAFKAVRGNSVGLLDRTSEWLKKARDNSLVNLETNRSKEYFNELANPEHTKTIIKSGTREAEQIALWDTELKDALYTNATTLAGKPDSTPLDLVDLEIQAIDALNAKYEGFDAESKKKAVSTGMSEYHDSVVQGKIVANLPFAKEYFKENKHLILPKEREALRLSIRKEDVSQTSKRIAAEIDLKVEDKNEWAAQVDKKTQDPEVAKEAKSILDAKKKDSDAHDVELKKRAYVEGLKGVQNAGNLEEAREIASSIEDPEDREKAMKVADTIRNRDKRDVETDLNVVGDVLDRINTGEFETATELLEFLPSLSAPDYKYLVGKLESYQKEVKTGKKAEGEVIAYSNAKEAFKNVFKLQTYNAEEHGSSFSAILRLLESQGKELSVGQAESVIRQHLVDNKLQAGTIPTSFFGIPTGSKVISYEEALEKDKVDEFIPNTFVLPEISEDENDEEILSIRSDFINIGYRDKIPDLMLRLYKKRYIDEVPLSFFEKQEFEKGLLTLERRDK